MDEAAPPERVYMWLAILTAVSLGAAITFGILFINEYKDQQFVQTIDENPFD